MSRAPHTRPSREIVRRATLYGVGFVVAAVVIAMAGAALIAWMLSRAGQPFFRTWLIVVLIVLLPGLIAAVIRALRRH